MIPIDGKQLIFSTRVYGVDRIDTIGMTFEIDLRLYIAFRPTQDDMNWEPELDNLAVFQNRVGDVTVVEATPTVSSKLFIGFKRKNWRIRVTITHNFSLYNFPVDTQQLPILIRIPRAKENGIHFISVTMEDRVIQSFGKMQHSWHFLKTDACMLLDTLGVKEIIKDGIDLNRFNASSKCEYAFVITVQRKFSYYIANIAVPNSLLVALNFGIFCLDYLDVSSRLQIILTILLTAVAFKFSVSSLLPVLSYQTALDTFCLGLLIFVVICAMESIIIAKLPEIVARIIDNVTVAVLGVSFIVYHIFWVVWLSKKRVRPQNLKTDQDWALLVSEDSAVARSEIRLPVPATIPLPPAVGGVI